MSGYTRRQALRALAAVGVGGVAASCGVVTQQAPAPKKSSAPLPAISFPSTGGTGTFEWMDTGGLKAPFEQAMIAAYHKANPGVNASYQGVPQTTLNQAVSLGVRNGNAPDIFQMPTLIPPQTAVNQGWVAPLDEIIPNFDRWKSIYPAGTFIDGVHVFNGKTYAWTFTSSRSQYGFLLMYDPAYMKQAGYNPSKPRFTWKEFRAAAKKITQQGSGQYYGLMISGDVLGATCLNFAELAGAPGGDFNWKTGEYNYTRPEWMAAIEFLLSMKSDGSFFPGYLSLNATLARAQMPQRHAAMVFDGPFNILSWEQMTPPYDFGVAPTPTEDGKWHPVGFEEGVALPLWVFAGSKSKSVAGALLSYMGSQVGQENLIKYTEGNFLSEIPQVNAAARRSGLLKGHALAASQIMQDTMRIEPLVEARNPDVAQVILEQHAVTPSLNDVATGIFSGQITDIKGALRSLQDRTEQGLDDAIKAAQAKGAKVSRDDWRFPNWDPTQDYTAEDYKALH